MTMISHRTTSETRPPKAGRFLQIQQQRHGRPMTTTMMKVLQCNANRCRAVHDLLHSVLSAGGYKVCHLSEPSRARAGASGCLADDRVDAGIWVTRDIAIRRRGKGEA